MSISIKRSNSAGFAAVEGFLILVILVAIAGVGAYVLHQKKVADTSLNNTAATSSTAATPTATTGTTASIDQLTQQDGQAEASVDSSSDTQVQQNAGSANAATSNVGGAYNENNL